MESNDNGKYLLYLSGVLVTSGLNVSGTCLLPLACMTASSGLPTLPRLSSKLFPDNRLRSL